MDRLSRTALVPLPAKAFLLHGCLQSVHMPRELYTALEREVPNEKSENDEEEGAFPRCSQMAGWSAMEAMRRTRWTMKL